MTEVNSSRPAHPRKPIKPKKPQKDFPLFAHNNGQWSKKVRGKIHHFGVWSNPQAALERWLAEKDDLLAGRTPRCREGVAEAPTLRSLVNQFLTTKAMLRDNGELSPHTWSGYHEVCQELVGTFGRDRMLTDLMPADFEKLRTKWAAKWGVVRLGAEINRARVVFNFAYKNRIIPAPIWFGEGFKRPSKKAMRLNRAKQGSKMFEADEVRRMIYAAQPPMNAMLLLAINAGLANNDVGQLPLKAVDLESGWLDYPRPKTGVSRRCPLWTETLGAIREWIDKRPTPKSADDAALVFLTFRGNGWTKDLKDRPITKECRKLLNRLGIAGNRNFYALRHTFETIGGESKDQVAVNAIMGHDDGSMASVYRERISDERLRAVTEHVRTWLFGKPEIDKSATPETKQA